MRQVEEWDSDPETAKIIPGCIEGLRTGRWSRDYLDAVGQLHWGGPSQWPRHQVAAFAHMHAYLESGLAAQVAIHVGRAPCRDAERDANASALANLPSPFTAHLDRTQRNADADGWLKWYSPITVLCATEAVYYPSRASNPTAVRAPRIIPPGEVPLEVGSSPPSRTFMHIHEDLGVARWPYESTHITLFVSSKFPEQAVEIWS